MSADQLDYDADAAARMLAELRQVDPAQRTDTLAVVIKAYVEVAVNEWNEAQ